MEESGYGAEETRKDRIKHKVVGAKNGSETSKGRKWIPPHQETAPQMPSFSPSLAQALGRNKRERALWFLHRQDCGGAASPPLKAWLCPPPLPAFCLPKVNALQGSRGSLGKKATHRVRSDASRNTGLLGALHHVIGNVIFHACLDQMRRKA